MIGAGIARLYRSRPRLPARFHIALGLCSVVTSVVLLATYAGFVPDRPSAVLEGQLALSEAVASSTSILLEQSNPVGIRDHLSFVVDRHPVLESVELHRLRNDSIATIGKVVTDRSRSITVPLNKAGRDWGELHFHFTGDAGTSGWLQRWQGSPFGLIAFISMLCFPVFYLYLGKMLKELNPSAAVPGRVRNALDTIAEALIVIDRKGNIVLANAAFAQLNGRTADALLGEQANSLAWRLLDDDQLRFPWHKALEQGQQTRNTMTGFIDCEGSLRKFLVNCSPVTGAEGRVGGVLISMDDVTQLEEKEMLLRRSMREAEEANQAKSAFLSNMSHEIRTPMTAILGFTEVLKRGKHLSADDQQRHLRTIANSGQHLLELINDVLDLSKVESGSLDVESIPSNVYETAHEVLKVMQVKADEKGITLKLDLLTDFPQWLPSDPSRLRQIITNLVGNAIKFTEQGGVGVALSFDAGRQTVCIAVRDSGIGMSAAQQATIFDAFTQADSTITRRFGGTGLGLSISRSLAQALGGEIEVESEPGQGSTFTLRLPADSLTQSDLRSPAELQSSVDSFVANSRTQWKFPHSEVLVVDDAAENRELLRLVLNDLGLSVTVAENGRLAIDLATANDYAVILMDIHMPVLNGYEAVAAMREMGLSLPVVALTANAMKGYERKVLDAGFSHYQTKPIDIDRLTSLLAELLDGVQVIADTDDTAAGISSSLIDTCSAESASGRIPVTPDSAMLRAETQTELSFQEPIVSTLAVNNPRLKPIVEKFINKLGPRLKSMRQLCERAQWDELAAEAHWLKGSGGTVGFTVLYEPALQLEKASVDHQAALALQLIEQIEHLSARLSSEVTVPEESMTADAQGTSEVPGTAETQGISAAQMTAELPVIHTGEDKNDASLLTEVAASLSISAERVDSPVTSSLLDKNVRFHSVVDRFIHKLQEQNHALDMACSNGDWDRIAGIAHWLKGSGGNVGFAELTRLAAVLEISASTRSMDEVTENREAINRYTNRIMLGWADGTAVRKSA